MDQRKFQRAISRYGDTVLKIAMVVLKNPHDADDALQETFLRYYKRDPQLESEEHERNWIIRCAYNTSKSIKKNILRHSHEPLTESVVAPSPGSLPDLLLQLPQKERIILQLCYVENYTCEEIAEILRKSPAAVRKQLERARKKAREIYEKEYV